MSDAAVVVLIAGEVFVTLWFIACRLDRWARQREFVESVDELDTMLLDGQLIGGSGKVYVRQ